MDLVNHAFTVKSTDLFSLQRELLKARTALCTMSDVLLVVCFNKMEINGKHL